ADDLVQEVWRATLAAERSDVRAPRAWLRGALRNVLRLRLRGDDRRAQRERAHRAGQPVEVPSASELAAEQDLRRQLLEHVDALPAGERDVVLLRFWKDLPPREVAAELGVPVDTVRSRTARALRRLRERLDAQHGDRRSWCLLLVPLLDAGSLTAAGAAPAAKAAKAAKVAAFVAVSFAALGGAAYVVHDQMTAYAPPDFASTAPASEALARFARPEVGAVERAPVGGAAAVTSADEVMVAGTVVDLTGAPVAGAFVHLERDWIYRSRVERGEWPADVVSATTDAAGAFALGPLRFDDARAFTIGEVTHPRFVAEREWTDCRLGAAPTLVVRRAWPVELDIEVVERATGAPVPRFEVTTSASWGRSSSADPSVVVVPDPQLRRLRELDGATSLDGRLRRTARVVEGVPNELRVVVPGVASFDEVLAFPARPGEAVKRRYEVDFDAGLREPGVVVARGRVTDAVTRQPVVGARVAWRGRRGDDDVEVTTMTRGGGAFALALAPGDAVAGWRVSHPDYEVCEHGADAAADALTISPLASLTVAVTRDAQPCPDVWLLAMFGPDRQRSDRQRPDRQRLQTDERGRARFERLPPGRVTVYVLPARRAANEQALDSFSFDLAPGDRVDQTLAIDGPDRVVVRGTVVRPRDVVVPLVPLWLPLDGAAGWVQAKPFGATGYRAGGLRRGRYLVMLVPADDGVRDGPFSLVGVEEVSGAIEQVVDVALPIGRVTGRVFGDAVSGDVSDGVAEGLHVVAIPSLPTRSPQVDDLLSSPALAANLGAEVGPDGGFALRHVADGPHELQLRRGARVLSRRPLVVVAGQAALGDWRIDVAEGGGR
ncbi:MAG: sigma-70 family RNA polymerase sigma factor, partial [Planctomycetes bacterium]|nr:sigma-70 family RNA polymerase sigma factor [Planctomycetota bacterium]